MSRPTSFRHGRSCPRPRHKQQNAGQAKALKGKLLPLPGRGVRARETATPMRQARRPIHGATMDLPSS